jgi:uncharacterized protein
MPSIISQRTVLLTFVHRGPPLPVWRISDYISPMSHKTHFAKKHSAPYVVKRGLNGLGLYTTKALLHGKRVIEYTGEHISQEEADRRCGQYLFNVSAQLVIDGRGRDNLARYINHSCTPNCYPEINNTETRVFIFAKRDIKPGEELTYNYGKEFWNEYIRPKGCRCKKCAART